MQILKNISKAELNHLTSQPTAKALIEKNKACAINIRRRTCCFKKDFGNDFEIKRFKTIILYLLIFIFIYDIIILCN